MLEEFSFKVGPTAVQNCGISADICEKLRLISANIAFSVKSHPENFERLEIIHMGIPVGLPIAHKSPASLSKIQQVEDFIRKLEKLRDILTSPDSKYAENPKFQIFQTLAKANPDPLEPFITPEWIAAQENISVEDFLINCAINIKFGRQIFYNIFYNADQEEFPPTVHFYKKQIFYTKNEAEFLDFFFHHADYLKNQFIDVPPLHLRPRENMLLTEAWMDVIKIQVLQGFESKILPDTKAAFDKLAPTGQKIQDLKNNYESLKILERSGSGSQHKNQRINEIYEKHTRAYLADPKPRNYNNILGFLLHKATNMFGGSNVDKDKNEPGNKL